MYADYTSPPTWVQILAPCTTLHNICADIHYIAFFSLYFQDTGYDWLKYVSCSLCKTETLSSVYPEDENLIAIFVFHISDSVGNWNI